MEFASVPIIVICCYVIAEIYKMIFQKKKEAYQYIPCISAGIGGILGIIIYLTHSEMILEASNIWIALGIGIVSGASATGTNQMIKQLFKNTKEEQVQKEGEI